MNLPRKMKLSHLYGREAGEAGLERSPFAHPKMGELLENNYRDARYMCLSFYQAYDRFFNPTKINTNESYQKMDRTNG